MKSNEQAPVYDERYYLEGFGAPTPYDRNDYWLGYFHGIADQIVRSLAPRRILDAGCAKGFLVEALWERGVEGYGIDISEYAISQVRRDMQPYCRCASLTEPIEGTFDLVTCIEVLEHIPEEQVRQALRNLTSITDTILFSSTSSDLTEPTHVNVRPIISWLQLFSEFDFAPVLGFDASFVAPHAMLLRRTRPTPPREVLTLFADLIRYRMTLTDRHNRIEHLERELQRLGRENELSASHIRNLEKERHASAQHTENLQRERQLSAQHIATLEKDRELSAQHIATLEKDRELSAQHAANLGSEIAAAREQAIHDAHEIAELREQLAAAASQAEQSRAETEKQDKEFQAVLAQCIDLTERVNHRTESLAVRLGSLEANVASVARQNLEILHSRTWRSLCAAGSVVLGVRSLFGGRQPKQRPAETLEPPAERPPVREWFELVCDEPRPDSETPRTGKIAVRGWALAENGVERIEVRLDSAQVSAQTGAVRPDVARSHPDLPNARNCGFETEIDTAGVPSGPHSLHIMAASRSGSVREIETHVYIDHEAGFCSDYARWIAEFEVRNPSLIHLKMRAFTRNPLISIVMPVYRTAAGVLKRALESVLAQSYPKWEFCIADDGSRSPEIDRILEEYAQREPRIKLKVLESNGGIVAASNAALEMAAGEFVALLDHDDELAEDALYYVVETLNLQPDLDIFYSDEDKIDERGKRYDPFFKPEWSPDLLLSENYIAHFLVARRELLMEVGAFRSGFDGSQDYDLLLRLTEMSDKIAHIPRVLYHWRAIATSTASVSTQKRYAADAARRAIEEHLQRRGIAATVVPGSINGRWRVRYEHQALAVSIIIASGGKVDILRNNLQNIFSKTDWRNYEVVVVDNSKKDDIQKLVNRWPDAPRALRYIDWRNQPFNYSTINNEAARHSESPILLFLNDDTSVISEDWLTAMVEMAARPEVGAVGAKLLYPDGRIQHAGVVMGIFDNCGHAFKGLAGEAQHYFDFPDVIRNVSAVTGACLMTRAEVFWEAGGFDEQTFAVAFNDIDLCLKIREKGYRIIYTPHAVMYHHEAFSKLAKDLMPHPNEVKAMQSKWKNVIVADPYYNPNLSRTAENYSLQRKAGIMAFRSEP